MSKLLHCPADFFDPRVYSAQSSETAIYIVLTPFLAAEGMDNPPSPPLVDYLQLADGKAADTITCTLFQL